MTTVHRIITGWAAVLAVAVASPAAASTRGPSTGEVVRTWNDTARSQPFENSLRLARILAIMHAAQHDAVNGARSRYETYVSTLRGRGADAEAAAAAAAHAVLVAFFPANRAALDVRLGESLSAVPDGDAEDAGVALGRAVGGIDLAARADDGYAGVDPFSPAPAPGVWEPTPPAFAPMLEPQFQNVAPFVLSDRSQFLPGPPPRVASRRYARDYDEVKLVGQDSSRVRTPEQTHLAHFWAEASPSGWSRVANVVSARHGYDLHRTARLQALLNMAMADGFIAGWFQKRHFAFWRPVTAIRKGATDGNPRTEPDPSWQSLRPTPPLPDYTSTHSLLGAAAAEILRRFTGTNRFGFCMVSTTSVPTGSERCWDSFTQAELENADSRVLVGFHFRSAVTTGVKVGRQVGQFAMRHALLPLSRGRATRRPRSHDPAPRIRMVRHDRQHSCRVPAPGGGAGTLVAVVPDVGANTCTKAEIKPIQRELRRMPSVTRASRANPTSSLTDPATRHPPLPLSDGCMRSRRPLAGSRTGRPAGARRPTIGVLASAEFVEERD